MLRIGQVESSATADGKYTDGSVAGGIAATRLRAAAFNAMQEELANIVESAGMPLDPDDVTQVLPALKKQFLSRVNPFADIKADGSAAVAAALSNLGLGEGTKTANGSLWLPGGWLLQWGISTTNASDGSSGTIANFPIAFPNGCFRMCGADVGNGANPFGFNPISATQFRHWGKDSAGSYTNTTTQYFAIGY